MSGNLFILIFLREYFVPEGTLGYLIFFIVLRLSHIMSGHKLCTAETMRSIKPYSMTSKEIILDVYFCYEMYPGNKHSEI